MSHQLTLNGCSQLQLADFDEETYGKDTVIQFLSVKKVTAGTDRYRLIISDGVHFIQAMLATQCNPLVENEEIKRYTVAAIEKAICNTVQEKRLVILLSVRILEHAPDKIGDPKALIEPNTNSTAQSTPAVNAASNTASTSSSNQQSQAPANQPSRPDARSASVFPIEGLSPYQNNWTIKARVSQKSDIKNWSNPRGEGKLFSVTFIDDSGEIKATAFNTVADELYSRLEEGKVYYVSKARVNFAKKKFSNLSNDYELTLERHTQIEECHEPTGLPQMKYNFVPLSDLEKCTSGTCDVIGVVKEVGQTVEITTRQTGRVIPKRELTLVDKSGCSVQLTLWGKQAESFNSEAGVVIAFKGVKVGDFGGVSLSMTTSSHMQVEPSMEQCFALRGWYDSEGTDMSFQSKTVLGGGGSGGGVGFNRAEARSLHDIKESGLGMNDKADYFSTQATIVHIRGENVYYAACTGAKCSKKMTLDGDTWVCDKCGNKADAPEYRYIISMAVADWSGQAWLQGFNDAGNVVFDMSANDLHNIREEDDNKYQAVIHKANCQTYNFSCRAKTDSFGDHVRVRYGISRIEPIDFKEEANYLLDLLRSPWAQ